MKNRRTQALAYLLMILMVFSVLTACRETLPGPETNSTSTTEGPGASSTGATSASDSTMSEPDSSATLGESEAIVPIEPIDDFEEIPDPTIHSDFAPRDGRIVNMGLFNGTEFGDTVGYASTIVAGGVFGPCTVSHKGKIYTVPGYSKTATEGQAAALDLSAYAESPVLRQAITDGYTIELTVQLTEETGKGFQALFSATQNGMFGLAMEDGHFVYQQYNGAEYAEVVSKEKIVVGELYHLVGVYDDTKKEIRLFVNGVIQNTARARNFSIGESPFIYVIGADVGYNHIVTDYPSPPAIFTRATVYDDAMSRSGVEALYKSAVRELAEPVTPIRPYHPSREYFFSDLKLSGIPKAGEEIEISATLENRSDTDRVFKLALSHPLIATACEARTQSIRVKAGSTSPVRFKVQLRDGGSMLFGLKLLSRSDLTVMSETVPLVAAGKGYYVGDGHTHTVLSDGKDTLTDHFGVARSKGQAFMIATDHNYDLTLTDPVLRAAANYDDFIALVGNEITTEVGHMLEYGVPHRHSGGKTGGMWEIMAAYRPDAAEWQRLFEEITSEGGVCYIAHPFFFSQTGSWKWPGVGADPTIVSVYKGFTGIEVYNCDSHANGLKQNGTAKAFEWWDRYNLKGEQRYYGSSNTDGHNKNIVTRTGNALLLEEITPESILECFKNGHFYGTNGAEIRFNINGVGMGDSLPLPADGKATLSLRVADQAAPLTRVILYTYTMTGNVDEAYKARRVETLFDAEKDGEAYSFELTREIHVQNGQFYRVEVYSASSLYGDYDVMGGFAFSNPIWIGDLIPAETPDVPEIERKLTTDKQVYVEGEDIFITVTADVKTDAILVYPAKFVPGQDASLYWARFEGYEGGTKMVKSGSTFKLTDIPGNNRGNHQADPYYDTLPAGEYKIILRGENDKILIQVNFTVVKP